MSTLREPLLPPGIAERLIESYEIGSQSSLHHLGGYELPSPVEVIAILDDLRELLFPGFTGRPRPPADELPEFVRSRIHLCAVRLRQQVFRGIHHRCRAAQDGCLTCGEAADEITRRFVDHLPALHVLLATDVAAAYDGDPAASGLDEILFCYPGMFAISVYRIAHALLRLGATIIPRMMTEHAHHRTGIDIHPGAEIGESFFIDHGTGVVVGETTVIGKRVRLYQGVTLGALSLPKERTHALRGARRHPTIEDDVIIYANATILGGDTVIGRGAVIGGNAWITESVPPGTRYSGLRPPVSGGAAGADRRIEKGNTGAGPGEDAGGD